MSGRRGNDNVRAVAACAGGIDDPTPARLPDRWRAVPQPAEATALIADTVYRTTSEVRGLADLVIAKTHGNPFFLREFLKALHREGLLRIGDGWTWDERAIAARDVTDNVVALMTEQLRALPAATQAALGIAGALGASFSLAALALALGEGRAPAWQALRPAIAAGLVVAIDDVHQLLDVKGEEGTGGLLDVADEIELRCRFSHDRIQQAPYAMIPEGERAAAHGLIGGRLRAAAEGGVPGGADTGLFDIVRHLNVARALAESPAARDLLAELNLAAARRALTSAAFSAAREHARIGLELLGEERLSRRYELAMALLSLGVETAYQSGERELMERWFAEGAAQVAEDLGKLRAWSASAPVNFAPKIALIEAARC